MSCTETAQQIFDLVQSLDGGGGIVDGLGQCLYGEIDEETQRVSGVLLKGAFPL
jgi:hypothetical protein